MTGYEGLSLLSFSDLGRGSLVGGLTCNIFSRACSTVSGYRVRPRFTSLTLSFSVIRSRLLFRRKWMTQQFFQISVRHSVSKIVNHYAVGNWIDVDRKDCVLGMSSEQPRQAEHDITILILADHQIIVVLKELRSRSIVHHSKRSLYAGCKLGAEDTYPLCRFDPISICPGNGTQEEAYDAYGSDLSCGASIECRRTDLLASKARTSPLLVASESKCSIALPSLSSAAPSVAAQVAIPNSSQKAEYLPSSSGSAYDDTMIYDAISPSSLPRAA